MEKLNCAKFSTRLNITYIRGLWGVKKIPHHILSSASWKKFFLKLWVKNYDGNEIVNHFKFLMMNRRKTLQKMRMSLCLIKKFWWRLKFFHLLATNGIKSFLSASTFKALTGKPWKKFGTFIFGFEKFS